MPVLAAKGADGDVLVAHEAANRVAEANLSVERGGRSLLEVLAEVNAGPSRIRRPRTATGTGSHGNRRGGTATSNASYGCKTFYCALCHYLKSKI